MGIAEKDAYGKIEIKNYVARKWRHENIDYSTKKRVIHNENGNKITLPPRQNMINMVIKFQCMKI